MKYILLLLLSSPLLSFAQQCQVKKSIDPYTKEERISTGFTEFGRGGERFKLTMDANSKEIEFIFSVPGSADGKCFNDASVANVVFEGGKLKSNYKNTLAMNCKGMFTITFKNATVTPSILQNLAKRKIMSIKLNSTDKSATEVIFTGAEQEVFMEMVSCIISESKALLKKS